MDERIPLSTLLSCVLVAFTIELDNDFEHRMPHRITRSAPDYLHKGGPWLGSMVLWFNCMRYVGDEGVRVGHAEELARTQTNLNGMRRWRYVDLAPDPADTRPKPPLRDWIMFPTRGGRLARDTWKELIGEIEIRWRQRFAGEALDRIRESLYGLVQQFELDLPDCMPILGYGFISDRGTFKLRSGGVELDLPLPSLLSKVLLMFAIEFEKRSDVSIATCANVLRVLNEEGVPVRHLPRLGCVSTEGVAMALGVLGKTGHVKIETVAKFKTAQLTQSSIEAKEKYGLLVREVEHEWSDKYGSAAVSQLRAELESLVVDGNSDSPLFEGLRPYPGGWRAKVSKPDGLPHFPWVLHRGGFPDGS